MDFIGKKVIIRANRAGVFYGTLTEKNGDEVVLKNARRLWFWSGAASISQIAMDGVKFPEKCKFTISVQSICIIGVIEIIECSEKSINCIENVKEWKI